MSRNFVISLNVSGMTCASCSSTIENMLNSMDGVETASVNLLSENARVVVGKRYIFH